MHNLLTQIDLLWEDYKLELAIYLTVITLFQYAWRAIKKAQGPGHDRLKNIKTVTVRLKPRHNWVLMPLILLFALVAIYSAIEDYGKPEFRDSLYFCISVLIVFPSLYHSGLKSLTVKTTLKSITIEDTRFLSREIAFVELWDNLIYIEDNYGREKKTWIKYSKKNFKDMVVLIKTIESFCTQHEVVLQNDFDYNMVSNTTFNKKKEPPKPWKKRWEDFSKIEPYEKLED